MKASGYRMLLKRLRPNDKENILALAESLFFELGEFQKAYDLVKHSRPLLKKKPELVMQIRLGHLFVQGKIKRLLQELHDLGGYRNDIVSPKMMFLIASILYIQEDYARSKRIYSELVSKFEQSPYTAKSRYFLERISAIEEK